jgi:hypothetical protein
MISTIPFNHPLKSLPKNVLPPAFISLRGPDGYSKLKKRASVTDGIYFSVFEQDFKDVYMVEL